MKFSDIGKKKSPPVSKTPAVPPSEKTPELPDAVTPISPPDPTSAVPQAKPPQERWPTRPATPPPVKVPAPGLNLEAQSEVARRAYGQAIRAMEGIIDNIADR